MVQDQGSAAEFAARWAAAWNRRDVEAVLAHFHDDVVFTSPPHEGGGDRIMTA